MRMVNQLQLTLMVQYQNSTGYTAQLKPQGVSDNTFNASVVSQDDSVALSAVAGVSGSSDYLVIGANGPYYRN